MQLAYYSLLIVGLIYLFTQSTIMRPYRVAVSSLGGFWATLVYCAPCSAFWIGLLVGLSDWWPRNAISSGVCAMAIGALWMEWGLHTDTWALDRGDYDYKSEEEDGEDTQAD